MYTEPEPGNSGATSSGPKPKDPVYIPHHHSHHPYWRIVQVRKTREIVVVQNIENLYVYEELPIDLFDQWYWEDKLGGYWCIPNWS